MPVEKLGWFRKALAAMGKRFYYWRSKKIKLVVINAMVRAILRIYAEQNGGNYEKGLREFTEQVEQESLYLVSRLIERPIALGISLGSLMARDYADFEFLTKLIFWVVLGKGYKDIWEEPIITIEEDGTLNFILREKVCLLCAGEKEITRRDLNDFTLGKALAALFAGVVQALQDYLGNEVRVTGKETKCFMRGDPYGEITITLTPKR